MKIKICGLTSLDDIKYVNEAMPDYAGFIFAKSSKRKITIEQAAKMKSYLQNKIQSVGVFVNEDIDIIAKIGQEGIINLIQLHGNEENNYILELKNKINLPIIKAFKITEDINNTKADFILFDSSYGNSFGGTGKTFDWGLIPKTNKKIFLAGGLNIQNIITAIKETNPYCVDINSGVETNGKKDRKKIIEIVNIIRGNKNE